MQRQKSFSSDDSKLYLVATPIGNLQEMSFRGLEILKKADVIACEDTRHTKKLCSYFDIHKPLISHHEHNIETSIKKIIDLLEDNKSVALVSDAGYPAISDPGYELVKAVTKKDIPIVSISGANAALNALVISGIEPQPFLFYGFLHHKQNKKKEQLLSLKQIPFTTIFYESPHRIKHTLQLILDVFGNRNIALCRELTKIHEEIIRGNIKEILNICEEIKGEIVIIVEKEEVEIKKINNEDIKKQIEKLIIKEISSKKIIEIITTENTISKNLAYQLYLETKKTA